MNAGRNVLIDVDGATLAADLYLPDGPGPFPTLLSFYPYRKDDVIGSSFEYPRRFLVEAGYAHLLVDVRGYGGSTGASVESMDPRSEGVDAASVVTWTVRQPWSTGAVGVWGVSYGGLVSFAVAAERPPALRAIASVYGFDDIYPDIIAPGGVPLALGRFAREAVMLAQELAPPTYQDTDGRWSAVWHERLERIRRDGPWSVRWGAHEGDADYWGERRIELERIDVPTLLIAGWRDLFAEPMTRALTRISSARRLIAGPWLHVVPDLGPEPIDWLNELRLFFDRHVRGIAEGEEPTGATVYVQGPCGHWRQLPTWPPPGGERRLLHPAAGGVLGDVSVTGEDVYASLATVGVEAGLMDPLGAGVGFPGDQAADDRRSLTYTTEPLAEELVVAGSPEAALALAFEPAGMVDVIAKLVDVAPDGAATLITTGWRAHDRDGSAAIRLAATAYSLPAGHRLRLSIACADFPRMWPSSHRVRLRLDRARSTLALPLLSPDAAVRSIEPPRPPAVADRAPWTVEGGPRWSVTRDHVAGTVSVTSGGAERMRPPNGTAFAIDHQATATVCDARPDGAKVEARARIEARLPAGEHVEVEVRALARRDRAHYEGLVTLDGQTVLEQLWGRV